MRNYAALAAMLSFALFSAGCQTAGSRGGDPDTDVAMTETGEGETEAMESGAAEPMAEDAMEETVAMEEDAPEAMSAKGGACSIALADGPPPVPNKVASFAGGAAENVGRNVTRNVGTRAANQVVGRIPGIGGVVGVAATQTAGREIIKTAEDVRGKWTATDGSPNCGCELQLSRPGMVMTRNVVKPKGCSSPVLAKAARWNVVKSGFTSQDLVLYAKDGRTVLAKLDRKGVDYFQGDAGGATITVWR